MDWIQSIVLGVVQGLTEFLPVSSTAHLVLVPWWMGWEDPGLSFDVALHLGTLIAVCTYFGRETRELLTAGARVVVRPLPRGDITKRRFWLIALATVPAVIVGVAGRELVATTLRDPVVVGSALIALAIVILAAERRGEGGRTMPEIGALDALLIGCAQATALVPGVSRSGATIGIALVIGLRRTDAVRFSFLLGIPVIAGACVLEAVEVARAGFGSIGAVGFLVGGAASAVSGYLCIAWLMRWVRTRTFSPFMLYRIAIGILTLLLAWQGLAPTSFGG
jgi:undecaprenyl-diphosphatase